jgi:hypothetical protein
MSRPIHYAAHGTRGLAFQCYYTELRAHVDAIKAVQSSAGPDKLLRDISPKAPLRHTDLNKVTCRACWREIAQLTELKLGAGWGDRLTTN